MAARKLEIRTLHLINGEHYSGGERVQDVLASTLPEFGYSVGFACVKPDMFPRFYSSRQSPIHLLPMRNKVDLSGLSELRRIIREGEYRIIHSHMPRTVLLGRLAARLERLPFVHHIHSPTLTEGPSPLHNMISGSIERLCLVRPAHVIGCSEGMGRYAARLGIEASRLTVVRNGIPPVGVMATRSPTDDDWVFGMVALFRERKGLEYLLHAVHLLRKEFPNMRLRAIGGFKSESYRREIEALTNHLEIDGCIDWVGFTDDVAKELEKLHVFVLPSTGGEGLPIALLEAMSARVPVIVTDIQGSNEVVRDGLDGYLCKPRDSESLANSMRKIMTAPQRWSEMSKAAYHRQHEMFSDISMAKGVAGVYDTLLRSRGARESMH